MHELLFETPQISQKPPSLSVSSSRKRSHEDVQKDTDTSKRLHVDEPILSDENKRYCLFPIRYEEVWDKYKAHEAAIWTLEELDFSKDSEDWEKLNDKEKHFIEYILAFFAGSDGIVNENLAVQFMKEVKIAEARCFYGVQNAMENIHSETYSMMIEMFVKDPARKDELFNAIDNIPCVQDKAQWALHWINNNDSFGERLVAFAAVEGIFFSGSFCSIFWFKKRGLLPGLCKSNEFISRDEGLHCDFACLLFSMLNNKPSEARVQEIIRDAVKCEEKFVRDSLPVALIGMNAEEMIQYIHCVADRLLVALGCNKIYNASNPFDWMELICLGGKANFFETRPSEYKKAGFTLSRSYSGLREETTTSWDLKADF